MKDETKELLIGFIAYYNSIGTESDPGFKEFESLVQHASRILEREAGKNCDASSECIDPFEIDFIGMDGQDYGGFPELPMKREEDW
jgi:hypothetical protein